MYRHFFWCAFIGNISIAAVSLLAKCTKHCMTCRSSQKLCLIMSHRTLISSTVLSKEAISFLWICLRAGVDIMGVTRQSPNSHFSRDTVESHFERVALAVVSALFYKLMNHSRATFNTLWSKSYAFQNRAKFMCKCAKGRFSRKCRQKTI